MTVELAVSLPVLLVVAAIAVNAGIVISECAAFDRVARNAVRICATSPSYGKAPDVLAGEVEELVETTMDAPFADISVTARETAYGHTAFTVRLEYRPTLFGFSLKAYGNGVRLPAVAHEVVMVVDRYKPGVLI